MNAEADSDSLFRELRAAMVSEQLEARGIRDSRVLKAMASLPRHLFVPPASRPQAYDDHPLPIPGGQTISQPYMVALMTERLELTGKEKVLEIGTGSGYQTALLSRLSRHVWSVERIPEALDFAKKNLKPCKNIDLVLADGTEGFAREAPFDRILVTAGSPPEIPDAYIEQLADPGILVIPAGGQGFQTLKIVKKSGGKISIRDDIDCVFVPLIGKKGW